MIEHLAWDTVFFGRKIGRLAQGLSAEELKHALQQALDGGYAYLTCRVPAAHMYDIQLLERHGFYLSDIAITWARMPDTEPPPASEVRAAAEPDRKSVGRIARGIFTDGRFYHDPFFSREEADRLYEAWASNLFEGLADVVFMIQGKGFIGCVTRGDTGHIPLVGVAPGSQGQGVGTALMRHALGWFGSRGATKVTVRTQAGNSRALHFYDRLGFFPAEVHVTLSRDLRSAAAMR